MRSTRLASCCWGQRYYYWTAAALDDDSAAAGRSLSLASPRGTLVHSSATSDHLSGTSDHLSATSDYLSEWYARLNESDHLSAMTDHLSGTPDRSSEASVHLSDGHCWGGSTRVRQRAGRAPGGRGLRHGGGGLLASSAVRTPVVGAAELLKVARRNGFALREFTF